MYEKYKEIWKQHKCQSIAKNLYKILETEYFKQIFVTCK